MTQQEILYGEKLINVVVRSDNSMIQEVILGPLWSEATVIFIADRSWWSIWKQIAAANLFYRWCQDIGFSMAERWNAIYCWQILQLLLFSQ